MRRRVTALNGLLARRPRPVRALVGLLHRDFDRTERAILLGVALLHVIAIGWGLPASDGWDVDGIAPRDFLPGVLKTFTPGDYFTYPPLHLLLLSLLTLPVSVVAVLRAPSLSQHDVIQAFLQVPVMTTFAYVARIVSLLMSLGIVMAMGRIAHAIFGRRAQPWALAIAGVEVGGTYYAHTSNLDIPALFWASLALLALVDALKEDAPRRLRRVGVLAACAIATKDQAYAVFALSIPTALVLWAVARHRAGTLRELVRETILLALITIGLVLLFDGALVNPTGFLARVHFLTGPASQNFAQYSHDWPGRIAAFEDAVGFVPQHYPLALIPFFVIGIALAFRPRSGVRIAAIVPLLAILSFTLTFNCVARRVEERFVLPQMQLLSVYGAGAIALVLEAIPRLTAWGRGGQRLLAWVVRLAAAAGVLLGLRMSASVIATMLGDPRYGAEAYLREHVQPGDVIEIYGSNVYLPRFPAPANVRRIGSGPVTLRNPMPDVTEVQDALGAVAARAPRWVVVSTGYAWRFLRVEDADTGGHQVPASQRASLADLDATHYMISLFASKAGYSVAHIFHYEGSRLLPARAIHASLDCDVWIFERR